ncbi:MAG: RsmB/NOP family class I SAM-dependent RNA methyltransferase [Alphaproteobacteria bacterium]|nr:RsmB/NOP family class I SAM-dependent RNA methyltransferase [Alphaproteobacteria bacterium]
MPHMVDKYSDRRAAYDILTLVHEQRRPLDEAIEMAKTFSTLDSLRDRAFALLIARTVLKRQGEVASCLQALIKRTPKGKPGRAVLRLMAIGVVQIVHLGVKPHAAVDGCVQLAAELGAPGLKGLVNAVLRRLAERQTEILAGIDPVLANTPEWLLKSWIETYGEDVARQIALANLSEPPLDITLRNGVDGWAEKLEATMLPMGSLRKRFGGLITDMPGFNEGAWWIQDAAAAIPARLLGDIQGKTVIDLCAAPGGKTAQLAAAGAKVIAVDRSKSRLKALIQNLTRLRMPATVIRADANEWQPEEPVDAILLDAPCSATGTIRRHPDILHLKTPSDIEALSRVQGTILENASKMLKPGGTIVYCTCSIEAVEGPAIVSEFLEDHPEFRRSPINPSELGGITEVLTADGDLRSLPFHLGDQGGMDGFYAARLQLVGGSA